MYLLRSRVLQHRHACFLATDSRKRDTLTSHDQVLHVPDTNGYQSLPFIEDYSSRSKASEHLVKWVGQRVCKTCRFWLSTRFLDPYQTLHEGCCDFMVQVTRAAVKVQRVCNSCRYLVCRMYLCRVGYQESALLGLKWAKLDQRDFPHSWQAKRRYMAWNRQKRGLL